MRIRSIKPEFWSSDDVTELTWYERLVWIGLWSYVDDNGVGRDRLASICGDLFSGDVERDPRETFARVSKALSALAEKGRIRRYEVNGRKYLLIEGWSRHQRIVNPSKSRNPLPTGHSSDSSIDLARSSQGSSERVTTGTEEPRNRVTEEGSSSDAADAAPDAAKPAAVSTEARTFCDLLLVLMAQNDERPRPAKVPDKWLLAADRMFRIDNRDGATALGLLRWAKQDDFWSPNIQSPAKFREQYVKLQAAAKRAVSTPGQSKERHLALVQQLHAEEQRAIGAGQ